MGQLDSLTLMKLQEIGSNPGKSFLEGIQPNIFINKSPITVPSQMFGLGNSSKLNDLKNNAITTVSSLEDSAESVTADAISTLLQSLGVANGILNFNYNEFVSEMVQSATTTLSKECTKAILDGVSSMIKLPSLSEITTLSLTYYKSYLNPIDKYLKELVQPSEEKLKTEDKKDELDQLNKICGDISYISGNVKKVSEKILGYTQSYIGMISSYCNQGPDWVASQLDKQVNAAVDQVKKYVKEQTKHIEDKKQKFISHQALCIGRSLAQESNDKLKVLAKSQLDKPKNLISKAKNKANSLIQKALFKVYSQTGINVPFNPSA